MSNLNLYFLGPPRIEVEGVVVNIRYSKATALLIYLAMSGEVQQRETLATLLWPESKATTARSSLRRELSHLKNAIGASCLIITRKTIGLASDVWVDVAEFEAALEQLEPDKPSVIRTLEKTMELYRSDFLTGFTLSNCAGFDEWQSLQTERLRHRFANGLKRLTNELSRQKAYEVAIRYARKWLAVDPLHEPAHRMLMRLYTLTGRQTAALRQFNQCEHLLHNELGIKPDAETLNLEKSIRERRLQLAKTSILSDSGGDSDVMLVERSADKRPIFIGRGPQLANLYQALAQTINHQGQIRFIVGEAGAGKSALVSQFIYKSQLTPPELLYVTGYCDAQTGRIDPYLPIRDVFKSLLSQQATKQDLREATCYALLEYGPQLLNVVVPTTLLRAVINTARQAGWQGDDPTTLSGQNLEQNQIFEQAVAVFQAIAKRFPLILVLEDLHWADSGSIGILFRLARHLVGHRILVIGTYRPEALRSDELGGSHPLKNMVLELQRNLSNIHIDLEEVRESEGLSLVAGILDAEPNQLDQSFRQALYHQTGGHPLFVVELVQELKNDSVLIKNGKGQWIMAAHVDWLSFPTRVEGAIAGRMAHLSETQRWFLTIASVMGESFLAEVIAHVAGEDPRELIRILSRTLQTAHRLVEAERVERINNQRLTHYRFRHNLIQVYLYERLDEVQKVYLHEDIARTLEALYAEERETISLTLAHHYETAGIMSKAVDYLIMASKTSISVAAFEEAYQHLSHALHLLDQLSDTNTRDQKEMVIQTHLGQYWTARKGATVTEVGAAYRRALELSHSLQATHTTLELLFALTQYSQMRLEFAQAKRYGEESLRLSQEFEDPELQMQVNKILHNIAHSEGRHLEATQYNGAIIDFYHKHRPLLPADDGLHLAYAYIKQSLNLVPCGYPQQALDQATKGLNLMKQHGSMLNVAAGLTFMAYVHLMRRDWLAVLDWTEQSLKILGELEVIQGITFSGMLRGVALAQLGDFMAGRELVMESLAERRRINSPYGELATLARLVETYGKHGRVEEGLTIINDVLPRIDEMNEREAEPEIYHVKGLLLLEQNLQGADLRDAQDEAEKYFRQSIKISQSRGTKLWEIRTLAHLCRLLHSQGRDEGSYQQLQALYNWFTEGFETEDLQLAQTVLAELA